MAVDFEGMKRIRKELSFAEGPTGLPFNITKIGHVVLFVRDMQRSLDFYTRVLGFRVCDIYPESMTVGGVSMAFMRCSHDHHGVALVCNPEMAGERHDLHHLAFEVGTIDEVIRARDFLKKHDVPIDFEGRRRAGCQVAVEFRDPDGHHLEIFWGLDQVGSGGQIRPPEEWREAHSLAEAVADAPPGQDTTLHDPTLKP